MPGTDALTVVAADEQQWEEYAKVAARSYGHRVEDVTRLYPYADARVGLRGGRVIAGGLGLLIPQFFGGRPVPSALIASGCVAPEERGRHLAAHMINERIRPLKEQGAVLAVLWTTSTGYAHHEGWEAPAQVFSWSLPTSELQRSFPGGTAGFEITHGISPDAEHLQRELAARWNGPLQRPAWWSTWQHDKHDLVTYGFTRPGQAPSGTLSLAFDQHPGGGARLVVHGFWARTHEVAVAMFAFLGRQSRINSIEFQRTGLPPHPPLVHHLHRAGSATAHHWHPWMIKILDPAAAVSARGWPPGPGLTVPLELDTDTGPWRYVLHIAEGRGELVPTTREGRVRMTGRQFAVWYAGGYRTPTAALFSGVTGDPTDVASFVRATADREPWLPDHF
ncbi:GNAT family N-acetyltransferase [Streptomyces sp. NPDC003860]